MENSSPCFFVKVLISPISAPATKDFSPAPVIINALILLVSIVSRVLSNSSRTWLFRAFKAFGLFIVKIAVVPSSSYFIKEVSSADMKWIIKVIVWPFFI